MAHAPMRPLSPVVSDTGTRPGRPVQAALRRVAMSPARFGSLHRDGPTTKRRGLPMTKGLAGITTSVDGYITGPDDGPGKGLGEGGERLHYWVFGGPWTYEAEPKGEPTGEDATWLAETISRTGAVVGGRNTYEAAGHWGDENPWGLPFFIVTHRPEEEPTGGAFMFVSGVKEAIDRAAEAAGDKDVNVMGGAEVIRQALAAGLADELSVLGAPGGLGGGKRP